MKNKVFIATSLDGYIADKNGNIDWLHKTPNPDNIDMGYSDFINSIDAIVMGRNTFETVLGFDIPWPYKQPVFVLSKKMKSLPNQYKNQVTLLNDSLTEALNHIHSKGHKNLYIDGGKTIQSFLKEDLIDEMIITTIPILLGGGINLFGEMPRPINFRCAKTNIFLKEVVQSHFIRKQ